MRKNIFLEKMLGHLVFMDRDYKFEKKCSLVGQGSYDASEHEEIKKMIKLVKDTLKSEDDSKDKDIYFKVKKHRLMSWL